MTGGSSKTSKAEPRGAGFEAPSLANDPLISDLSPLEPSLAPAAYRLDGQFGVVAMMRASSSLMGFFAAWVVVIVLAVIHGLYIPAAIVAGLGGTSSAWLASFVRRFDPSNSQSGGPQSRFNAEILLATLVGALMWAYSLLAVYPHIDVELRAIFIITMVISIGLSASFMTLARPTYIVYVTVVGAGFIATYVINSLNHALFWIGFYFVFAVEVFRIVKKRHANAYRMAARLAQVSQGHVKSKQKFQDAIADTHKKTEMTLRASFESRNLFLAKVSHEIRTPLQIIISAVDLLTEELEDYKDPIVLKALRNLETVANQLVSISDDMAAYLRTNATTIVVKKEAVDIGQLIDGVLALHEAKAKQKELVLQFSPPPEPIILQVDPNRLRQIVDNLVANAVKYTAAGSIDVSCARSAEGKITIRVSDTGVGIPADGLRHIFEPWYRIDQTKQGLGLGLAIVKATADAIQATVGIESTVGRGTVVSVVLPGQKQPSPPKPP